MTATEPTPFPYEHPDYELPTHGTPTDRPEFIIRLTDEQERLLRLAKYKLTATERVQLQNLQDDLLNQTRLALALYDQLVAEAKAKSDD